ncbi:MAG: hypothetical protein WCJ74_01200, partial [bacterium]
RNKSTQNTERSDNILCRPRYSGDLKSKFKYLNSKQIHFIFPVKFMPVSTNETLFTIVKSVQV